MIALLLASDIPARYVAGEVTVPIDMAMNWVGTEDPEVAVKVFSRNRIPSEVVMGSQDSNEITGIKMYRFWVEAYFNSSEKQKKPKKEKKVKKLKKQIKLSTWNSMDPSFKQYTYHEGINIPEAMDLDPEALLSGALEGTDLHEIYIRGINEVNLKADLDIYTDNLNSYVSQNMPDATMGDVMGYREIRTDSPILSKTVEERFSEIPKSMRYLVNITIGDGVGINYTTSTAEIADKSIIISYAPASQEDIDIIEEAGGILRVDPILVQVRPSLKIDGEVVAEGATVMLGSKPAVTIGFLRPERTEWETTDKNLTACNSHAIVVNTYRYSADFLMHKVNALGDLIESLPSEDSLEVIEEKMYLIGLSYFVDVCHQNDLMGKTLDIIWTKHPSMCIVHEEMAGFSFRIFNGPMTIDVRRNIVNPISATGSRENELSWMHAVGSIGSSAEHAALERLYGGEAVSAAKVLKLRHKEGIIILTKDTVNANIIYVSASIYQKHMIKELARAGYTVLCPHKYTYVNDWRGTAIVAFDPVTGASGYMLTGRINGGSNTQFGPIFGYGDTYDKFAEFALMCHFMLSGATFIYIGIGGPLPAKLLATGVVFGTLPGAILLTVGIATLAVTGYMVCKCTGH